MQQRDVLLFILAYRSREKISPTHREIMENFGWSSYGTVHTKIVALRDAGFVMLVKQQQRGVLPTAKARRIADAGGASLPDAIRAAGESRWFRPLALRSTGTAYRVTDGETRLVCAEGGNVLMTSRVSHLSGQWEVVEPEDVVAERKIDDREFR